MSYHDLHALLDSSSSTREYFLSLPIDLQIKLHQKKELVHTADDLHRLALILRRDTGSSAF
ncbi:MAG: hypothetical protein ACOYJZ_08550 [Acutalibacter sp.]|jgi:hypothetical protein